MDEADKYKQRLEAIAEKRRLQEEQDRARREMEDEKLRLQQLKRKSLRDQWLMEGAPLSPTSPDSQSPRSPLWGSQAQEIEKRIDKLQSESQRLAEEEEKLKEQMEGGQTDAVKVTEAGSELVHHAVVQNGENDAPGLETTEDEVKTNQSFLIDETAAVLTNGAGEADTNHDASELSNQSTTNGPIVASQGVISMKYEPESSLGVSEASLVPNVTINAEEEEEDGILVMRAERVIITDEGEELRENRTLQEVQQEAMQSEETPLPNPEAGQEAGEAVEEVMKTEAAPATEATADTQPATGDGDMQDGAKINENGDGETKAEGQDKQSEDPISAQVQSPAEALEGTTVASVPVYSEAQPSALTPDLEAKGEAAMSAEGAEAALKAQDPATLPGRFQEVPLADPQENQKGEQEPLLSQTKALNTQAGPSAAANSPASTETHIPNRASQGEAAEAPKRKTCQCCSVM
ncbi:paralemmin-3 [Pempheris klunzingeri]|uniref:paralemmin-3 n=1 Tax=Pempheris klunzingeri TaxID=3127111 RepID=UPI003981464C